MSIQADEYDDIFNEGMLYAIDEVLEIIDQMDKEAVEDFELDTDYGLAVVHDRFAKARKKIKALKEKEVIRNERL